MPTTAFAKGIRELAAKDRLKAARVREAITMATGVRRSQYFERQNGNVPLSPRREEGSRPDIPPLPDNRPLGRMKCDADILSRAETRVMQAVINTKGRQYNTDSGISARHVSGRGQYAVGDVRQVAGRIRRESNDSGAGCLVLQVRDRASHRGRLPAGFCFCAYTFGGGEFERAARRTRRSRREVEYVIEA